MEVKRKNFFYFLPGLKPSEAKHGRQPHQDILFNDDVVIIFFKNLYNRWCDNP